MAGTFVMTSTATISKGKIDAEMLENHMGRDDYACDQCERFFDRREVNFIEGEACCPVCRSKLEESE
jgi:formylmethanofuran dehydrogenase subunit E